MDGGAWQATVHGVAKSQTRLSDFPFYHLYCTQYIPQRAFQVALVVKNLPANSGDIRDADLIPGLERSLGEGKVYPLGYYGLETSMDCIVHGVAKSQTRLAASPDR